MALKQYKPVTSSMRQLILVDRKELWKGKPLKELTEGLVRTGGRNAHGRITTRHIGGRHKRRYRLIDFKRTKLDIPAVVERIEYDPNRTAFIALIRYEDGEYSYIIAPQRLNVGDKVISASEKADVKPGNAMPLGNIPVGSVIHNIEMKPGKGAQIVRSAGTYAQYVGRDTGVAIIRLSSGEVRMIPLTCRAVIGAVSNPDQKNISIGKAGRNRWMGIRPTVRGVAMNPVDHPHGGGEGKTAAGRHPVSPWGKHTKGKKTRSRKKASSKFIVTRRKK
ncbi:MAG: 50S ribosomal protein L2 [Alphaproteobacteria bacterium]|nr:50S ribosomal protein L2 [Alphaproteobacteria bacterium]